MSVWACSDLHGNKNLLKAIKEKIGPNDTVYFLGDACDRGPDGWEMIKEILADKRFIYLKGNHEDMLIKAHNEYFEGGRGEAIKLCVWNGGQPTLKAMLADDNFIREHTITELALLPLTAEYTNTSGELIHMSHAGFSMGVDEPSSHDWVWDRTHFLDTNWLGPDNAIVVHGHTPIPFLVEEISSYYEGLAEEEIEPGAFWYCGGHKIDIDCGTHFTGMTVLLNLDTFDEEIFSL